MACFKLFSLFFLTTVKQLINGESIHNRHEYAYALIQEIYENYPEYITKLLEYHTNMKKFNMKNETYRGYIRQMRRNNKYELLIADAYTYNFKNKVYETGKHPNTVLYQCDKAIRYSSGNPMYCEYIEGSYDSNIILVSGHGGELRPDSIPDRVAGCWANNSCLYKHECQDPGKGIWLDAERCSVVDNADVTTSKITRWVADKLFQISGKRPHLIINNLHRNKIDMNREMPLSTFDVPEANQAWRDYHELIETAKSNLNGKRGLILDIHGNDLNEQWNMFGYGIDSNLLNSGEFMPRDSNIRSLGEYVNVTFDNLIRGKNSLGHFMQTHGIRSIPSIDYKSPGSRSYFPGAYTVDNHGSRSKGHVDSIMVEIYTKYRDDENGKIFAEALADSVNKYYKLNYVNQGVMADYYADIKGDKLQDNYYSKSKGNVQESQEEVDSENGNNNGESEKQFKNFKESNNYQQPSDGSRSNNNEDDNSNSNASISRNDSSNGESSINNVEYSPQAHTNGDSASTNSPSNQHNMSPSNYPHETLTNPRPEGSAHYHDQQSGSGQSENPTVDNTANTRQNDSSNYYFGHVYRPVVYSKLTKKSRDSNSQRQPNGQ